MENCARELDVTISISLVSLEFPNSDKSHRYVTWNIVDEEVSQALGKG